MDFKLIVSVCAVLACTIQYSETAGQHLPRIQPLLWRSTSRPVVDGMKNVFVMVNYSSPCERALFPKNLTLHYNVAVELIKWCKIAYERDFLKPIRNFCHDSYETDQAMINFRYKRFVLSTIGVTALIISNLFTVGLASFSYMKEIGMENRIDELRANQKQLLLVADTLYNNDGYAKHAFDTISETLHQMSSRMNHISMRLDSLEIGLSESVTFVSELHSRLSIIRESLKQVGRSWKEGVFDYRLLDVFNISLPCNDEICPPSLFKPGSCLIDESRQSLMFTFRVQTVRPTARLMRASPFELYETRKNGTVCHVTYTGPEYVLYDESHNCVNPVRNRVAEDRNEVLFAPSQEYCHLMMARNHTPHMWKVGKCFDPNDLTEEEVVQIKTTRGSNYVYCHHFHITMYGRRIPCPSFPFIVPANVTLNIGRIRFTSSSVSLNQNLNVLPGMSHKINFVLQAGYSDSLIQHALVDIDKEISRIVTTKSDLFEILLEANYTNPVFWIFMLVVLCLGLVIYCKYMQEANRSMRTGYQAVARSVADGLDTLRVRKRNVNNSGNVDSGMSEMTSPA